MNSFNNFNLDTEILKSLDILDYKIPSQVQSRVIPVLLDKKDILSLVDLFVNAGYAVYVDWIEDEELDRSEVTPKTAQLLKKRMNSSQGLAYVASSNTAQSKW